MPKVDAHRAVLRELTDWLPYLDANSGLPGPRGNLELVAACGEEADVARAEELIDSGDAPRNTLAGLESGVKGAQAALLS